MKRLLLLLLASLLAACSGISALERGQHIDALASAGDWRKLRLPAGAFVLTAYAPRQPAKASVLTVYIEGDGQAWLSRSQPSDNPTPRRPLALELALRHGSGAAAYLARPCQNVTEADWGACRQSDWTNRRFAPAAITASDLAIDSLKALFGADRLVLVGYSGGGAIAALVAARRHDVSALVTVAGNLDTRAWTAFHRVEPLSGSRNPADDWESLQNIPQLHFVGGRDQVINSATVGAYADRFPAARRPPVRVVADFDHACCWVEHWPQLAREALAPGF